MSSFYLSLPNVNAKMPKQFGLVCLHCMRKYSTLLVEAAIYIFCNKKMPQIFQVLRCYKCSVFQVHQTKKANKFVCKLCGDKQSIKRHYGLGAAKDCRLHVQKLNSIRKNIDELNNTISSSEEEPETSPTEVIKQNPTESKWSAYVENTETNNTEETIYLENEEVVLEVPKKKYCRKNSIKNTHIVSKSIDTPLLENNRSSSKINSVEDIARHIDFLNQNTFDNSLSDTNISLSCSKTKESFSLVQKNRNLENKVHVGSKCNVSNDRKLEPKNIKNNVPVSRTSKWAQFVDNGSVEEYLECSNNIEKSQEIENTKTLFSLCDDNEIDNILNI